MTNAAGWSGGAEQPYGVLEADPNDGEGAGERSARLQPTSQGHRAATWNLDPNDAFDPAEFAEFLDADDSPIPADPAFKERLRQRLWGMVRDNAGATTTPSAPSRIGDRTRRPLPDPDPDTKRPR